MPGSRGKSILAGVAALLVLLLAGCGGEGGGGEIPQPAADEMLRLVDEIEQANADEDCDAAQSATTDLRNRVDALEDSGTKDALNEMIDRLDENLDEECPPGGTTDEEIETAPVEPVEPVEPTTTTTTTTEPEEGEAKPEKPPKPAKPEDDEQAPPQTSPGQAGGGPATGGLEDGD